MARKKPTIRSPDDTAWDLFRIRFVAKPQGDKWLVLIESRSGTNPIGARLIKGPPDDLSYPDLDYEFDTEEEANRRAQAWESYVCRKWPRIDK